MDDTITISLQELIASRCLSRSRILFDHERVDDVNVMAKVHCDGHDDEDYRNKLFHINAAKVSLLLAKFVYQYSLNGYYHDRPTLSSLNKSNIIFQIKCRSPVESLGVDVDVDVDVGCNNLDSSKNAQSLLQQDGNNDDNPSMISGEFRSSSAFSFDNRDPDNIFSQENNEATAIADANRFLGMHLSRSTIETNQHQIADLNPNEPTLTQTENSNDSPTFLDRRHEKGDQILLRQMMYLL